MHIGIVLAIGLCIVIGIPAFLIFLLAPRLSGRKRVHPFLGVKWAHRGLHDKKRGIPENSFPAFRAAIEAGDGIELDVHLTKDGQLVVFHDDTFERICGRRGRVEDTSYEEMQKYRLAETKERIPLLSEVLQLVDGKVPLLIEVKLPNTDTKICRKLDEELRKYHGEYMIQSFNSLVLRWMKKYRNEIPRGQLSENLRKNKEQYVLEHIYVCTDSCSGVYVFVHIQMGNLGSRTCDLRRNVCLLRSSLLAVFTGQNGASFLQAGVFCKYGKADHKLRDAELSQQHCRACYIYSAEHFAFANGGSAGGICLWNPYVCRRLCTASSLWHVRFSAAGSQL